MERTRGQAWKLSLICFDTTGETIDPEELFREMASDGFKTRQTSWRRADIICELVTPVDPVDDKGMSATGLLDEDYSQ